MPANVFISYTTADRAFARRLAEAIERSGARVWIDVAELKVGDSLIAAIAKSIRGADFLIALLSRASVESGWVHKELALAMTREIREKRVLVLPVLLEDCRMPEGLEDKSYADFRDAAAFDDGMRLLLSAMGLGRAPPAGVEDPGHPEAADFPAWLSIDDGESVSTIPYDYEKLIALLRNGHKVGHGFTREEAQRDANEKYRGNPRWREQEGPAPPGSSPPTGRSHGRGPPS